MGVTAVSLRELDALAAAWRSEHPDRAAGGLRALSGFSFQLLVALSRAVEVWLESTPAERLDGAAFRAELVSDAAWVVPDDLLVVCQVKRTASTASVRRALADLWTVHLVAERSFRDLVPRLRYQLVFRSGSSETVTRTVREWAGEDQDARAAFAQAVGSEIVEDPEQVLVSALFNDLGATDPFRLVREWVGDLIAATSQPGLDAQRAGLAVAAQRVWADLLSLESGGRLPFYLWSPHDRPPERSGRGEVLTGQSPTVPQLREGYFAERPAVLNSLMERFRALAQEADDTAIHDPRPLIFWIGGRSGSGKSVLLLQLLSRLHRQGWDPIVWLARSSSQLPGALAWAREHLGEGPPPIVGLDDPYVPNSAAAQWEIWRAALEEVERWKQSADRNGLPLIVCCGPSEQAALLRQEYGDVVRVRETTVDPVPPDLSDLREWFRERTGRSAPGFDDESNLLLVQLFAEWRSGETLAAFAKRFRRRLKAVEGPDKLLPFVTRMLAMNRLYVGYPEAAEPAELSGAQRNTLARLRAEEHIVTTEPHGGRAGLWLAHPHLANVIYEQWHGPDGPLSDRAEHFRDAVRASLRYGATSSERTAPLRVLGLALAGDPTPAGERVEATFVESIPEVYRESLEGANGHLGLDELAAWVKVRTASGVALDPDPVDEALPMLTPQALTRYGAGWIVQALLEGLDALDDDQRHDVLTLTVALLRAAPTWVDWAKTARLLLRWNQADDVRELCVNWLAKRWRTDAAGWPTGGFPSSTCRPRPSSR